MPPLDSGTSSLLRTLLDDSPGVLPFAEAVVLHLSSGSWAKESRAKVVASVIEVLTGEADDETAADILSSNPILLASFFQNADLLDPSAPETPIIARAVMKAMERIQDRPV